MAFFLTTAAQARTLDLLKCLGVEEKRLHLKKDMGPNYDLNQKLMAEVIQIPNLQVEAGALKTICSSQSYGESWKLLQLSLIQGESLFSVTPDITGMQKKIAESMISDYLEAVREILLGLISQIQALAPTPDCLTTEFPRLVPFFRDMKYLQEEIDANQIFKGRGEKIFADLRNYRRAIKNCQARLKNTPKSESKAGAKKP